MRSEAMKVLTAAVLVAGALLGTETPAAAANQRHTVVISDLHFGPGRNEAGWHVMEDFRWTDEFVEFLGHLDAMGAGKVDLVLNGDVFELWQTDSPACRHDDKNLGCAEPGALQRASVAVAAHRTELEALGKFAARNQNRVYVIPGNHDAALLFPKVSQLVLKAIAAPADRVSIVAAGHWLSSDGRILADHGQQIGRDPNRFDAWPSPFREHGGTKYLQRTWGEAFVQDFYDPYELRFEVIDNLADEAVGVQYGLKASGRADIAAGAKDFLRFYLIDSSFGHLVQSLGDDGAGEVKWDLAKIRTKGDAFLVESVASDDPMRAALAEAKRKGTLGLRLADLSDEELNAICERRAELRAMAEAEGASPKISDCDKVGGSLGGVAYSAVVSRKKALSKYLVTATEQLKAAGKLTAVPPLYVFSHTHRFEQFSVDAGDTKVAVLNTGAWQRVATKDQFERIRGKIDPKEALLRIKLEDFPACYSLVHIPPYEGTPKGEVRFWYTAAGKPGALVKACPAAAARPLKLGN